MTQEAEISKQDVKHEILEVLESENFEAIDAFIAEKADPAQWKLNLTQSEDVEEWLTDPTQISRIQNNLAHFDEEIKSLDGPLSILDAGCYAGYVYDYICRFILANESDFSYTGIDIRESAIHAAQHAHAKCDNATFRTADIFHLEEKFSEGQFDLVLSSRVLVHLPKFESAIRNLISVCKNSTIVFVPHSEHPRCEIRKKTDLSSGAEMIYVYRSFSSQMISKVAAQDAVSFEIKPTTDAYASVIFRKGPKSSDVKSQTLLSRIGIPWRKAGP